MNLSEIETILSDGEIVPQSRIEKILVGEDTVPQSRIEQLLKEILGGSGGGSVPKPLTYDYMPEGYPKKTVQTTALMEEQEVGFVDDKDKYLGLITPAFAITEGQTYTVNWDGTEYECVCSVFNSLPALGNLSLLGAIDDTGEPFLYVSASGVFITLDTSASHTISVKTAEETVVPMAEEFLPANTKNTTVFYYV